MKKTYKYIFIVMGSCVMLLASLLIYCSYSFSKPINQEEMYGTYVADYKYATERITLNQDGTLIQQVTLKSTSKVDVAQGTWFYDPGLNIVTFINYLKVMDISGNFLADYSIPSTIASGRSPHWFLGQIYIGDPLGDTNTFAYKKIRTVSRGRGY